MSSDKEKLDDLSARIRKVEAELNPEPKGESSPWRSAGYDFAGTMLGSVVLGVLLDRYFETAPWILVGMIVLGFIAGVCGVWKMMQKSSDDDKD